MNRTPSQWAAMVPDAFLDGSIVQARNIIAMAQQDIAELTKLAREYEASLNEAKQIASDISRWAAPTKGNE